jgi:hypothetical protein
MAPRTRLQWLRPFTTRFVNPVTRVVAGWLPGFGILRYRGRTSGKDYRPFLRFMRVTEFLRMRIDRPNREPGCGRPA